MTSVDEFSSSADVSTSCYDRSAATAQAAPIPGTTLVAAENQVLSDIKSNTVQRNEDEQQHADDIAARGLLTSAKGIFGQCLPGFCGPKKPKKPNTSPSGETLDSSTLLPPLPVVPAYMRPLNKEKDLVRFKPYTRSTSTSALPREPYFSSPLYTDEILYTQIAQGAEVKSGKVVPGRSREFYINRGPDTTPGHFELFRPLPIPRSMSLDRPSRLQQDTRIL